MDNSQHGKKKTITLLLSASLALLLSTSALATVEEGEAAFDRGDFATAFKEFKTWAEKGDWQAQSNLGSLYEQGQGVAADEAESVKWYQKAADQGHAGAQRVMGVRYVKGEMGVEKDIKKGLKLLKKSANNDNVKAQFALGSFYYTGEAGVEIDKSEAAKWWTMAADQDNVDAQFNLGIMYHNGEGVKENQAKSKLWLQKAANQGHQNAAKFLNKFFN